MNKDKEKALLHDVLDEYAMDEPTPERLQAWIHAYPRFKDELVAYTVQAAMQNWLLESDDGGESATDHEDLVQYGMELWGQMLEREEPSSETEAELHTGTGYEQRPETLLRQGDPTSPPNLSAFISSLGHNPEEVVKAAGLGFVLLAMFDEGRIIFSSEETRDVIAQRIAKIVGVSVALIKQHLQSRVRFGRGTHYATDKPEMKTQDFFEAIRLDPLLSPEEKERWFTLQP